MLRIAVAESVSIHVAVEENILSNIRMIELVTDHKSIHNRSL